MLKQIIILYIVVVTFVSSLSFAQQPDSESIFLAGDYRVDVTVMDPDEWYPAKISFTVSDDGKITMGKVNYTTYGCTAEVVPTNISSNGVVLQERIVVGQDLCEPSGYEIHVNPSLPFHADKVGYLAVISSGDGVRYQTKNDAYSFTPTPYSSFRMRFQVKGWQDIAGSNDVIVLDSYIALRGSTDKGRRALDILFSVVKSKDNWKTYLHFMDTYPKSNYIVEAVNKLFMLARQHDKQITLIKQLGKRVDSPAAVTSVYSHVKELENIQLLEEFVQQFRSASYLPHNEINEELARLYRREQTVSGYLIAWDKVKNEGDFTAAVALSRSPEDKKKLLETIARMSGKEKEILIQIYRQRSTYKSFYAAYLVSRDSNDVKMMLTDVGDLSFLSQFISDKPELKTHNLVINKIADFHRAKGTPNGYYEAYLLTSNSDDVEKILRDMSTMDLLSVFVADKSRLRSHKLVKKKRASFYRESGDFEGFMLAFQETGEKKDIEKAYQAVVASRKKTELEKSLLDLFYENYVLSVKNMDPFITFLAKVKLENKQEYFLKLMTSNGFGDSLTLANYFKSDEYKKVLKPYRPQMIVTGAGGYVTVLVKYPQKDLIFEFPADCEYEEQVSKTSDSVGLLVAMFSSATSRTSYYNVDQCKPYIKNLEDIKKFETQLLGRATSHNLNWEVSTFAYSELNYPPASSSSSASSSSYVACNAGDKCYEITERVNAYRYKIRCTKGMSAGMEKEVCGKDYGKKWASGCGLGDAFAFHYSSAEQAAQKACDY